MRTFKGEEKLDDLWGWGEGGAIRLWLRVLNSFLRLFGQSYFLFVLIHTRKEKEKKNKTKKEKEKETRFINIQQGTLTFTDLIPVEQILKKLLSCFKVLEYGIHYRTTSKIPRLLVYSSV